MDNLVKNIVLFPFNILYKISPKRTLQLLFRIKCGYKLNINAPKTYNEKIQWIKLYDRNPLMPICSDKYLVRGYVKDKVGDEILNELLWEGFRPEEIPFDILPEKFVIKVTHGSTFNIICKDKTTLDPRDVINKCNKWLNAKFLEAYGEWFYGEERPRIIVENYLDDGTERLRDYKVYCFNGCPRFIGVDIGRKGIHYKDIYDTEWNLLPKYKMAYPTSGCSIEKPEVLEALLEYAKKLSEDFLHARVDFYIIKDKIIFGEITFTNSAGFGNVSPPEFALEMGAYLKLPIEKCN